MAIKTYSRTVGLKDCFADPLLDVMNFLSEVVDEFPDAISFAPGRPLESLFRVEEHLGAIGRYVGAVAARTSRDPHQVWQDLGQTTRTNGIITEAIAAHLRIDEGIDVPPEAIMVTVGAQEAMAVLAMGLFDPRTDVLLVSDPSYIGFTGLARLLGVRIVPVPAGDGGLDRDVLERAIAAASRTGRARALYDIPDFNNPLGTSMSVADRHRLLDLCERHDLLLLEDNAYGMFAYDGERRPTLKSLDEHGVVIYIGSFSKTLFPGLRLGYLVADQEVSPGGERLARALSRVKSLLTINTPSVLQAAVAAVLFETGGSLEPVVAPKRDRYRCQRDAMIRRSTLRSPIWVGWWWNTPAGGFFLSVTMPFPFGPDEVRRCAAEYGVIVCPMQFFSLTGARQRQLRLAFSYVDPGRIAAGIAALGGFVRAELARGSDRLSG